MTRGSNVPLEMAHHHNRTELPETEVRYERSGPGFLARQAEWIGDLLVRLVVYALILVALSVGLLYACGAAGEAVQKTFDSVTTTTTAP